MGAKSGSNDLSNMVENLKSFVNYIEEELNGNTMKNIKQIFNDDMERVRFDLGEFQRRETVSTFNMAVTTWYESYTPETHKPKRYKRHGDTQLCEDGLYTVLDLSDAYNDDGTMNLDENIIYTDANMTHAKNGTNLFQQVFVDGYHGGAYGNPSDPGTPYYRAGFNFSTWGSPAYRSESAYSMMHSWLGTVDPLFGDKFISMATDKFNNETSPKIGAEWKAMLSRGFIKFFKV